MMAWLLTQGVSARDRKTLVAMADSRFLRFYD